VLQFNSLFIFNPSRELDVRNSTLDSRQRCLSHTEPNFFFLHDLNPWSRTLTHWNQNAKNRYAMVTRGSIFHFPRFSYLPQTNWKSRSIFFRWRAWASVQATKFQPCTILCFSTMLGANLIGKWRLLVWNTCRVRGMMHQHLSIAGQGRKHLKNDGTKSNLNNARCFSTNVVVTTTVKQLLHQQYSS